MISDDIIYGRQALSKGEPWIVPESLRFLEGIIQPDWAVWEWGSGGSTIWFARNCKFTYSVEHGQKWFHWTRKRLQKEQLMHKARLICVPGDKETRVDQPFRYYANVIHDYIMQYELLDLVFVDGEASSRGWCVGNAVKYLRPGGWLVLDNSDWYRGAHTPDWERFDFVAKDLKWIGQKGTFNWHTSLLQKPFDSQYRGPMESSDVIEVALAVDKAGF